MQPPAAHEALGDVGGLEGASLGRRMGGEVARDSDQHMAALVGCAPCLILAHARLEHLEGVEARVLAQQGVGEGGEEILGRMAEQEIAGDEPGRRADLLLAVERLEQRMADLGRIILGHDLTSLSRALRDELTTATPLWFYVLREAGLDGGRLGAVGGRIVAETFHRAMEGSRISILRDPFFRPIFGPHPDVFRMTDLLKMLMTPPGAKSAPFRPMPHSAPVLWKHP